MGTKMECENYSPGYFFTRRNNLNEVTQPSWSLCHEQHTMPPNRHLIHGGFSRSTTNTISNGGGGYLDYDTQVLKQTMLTHEATFRNQVHELHRVYRIQREMMDELKKVDRFSRFRPYSSQFGALLDNRDKEDDDDVVEIKKEIVTLPFFGTKTPSNKVAAAANVKLSLGTYRESGSGLVDLNEPVSEFCDKDEDGDAAVLSNGPSVKLDLGSQTPRKQFWKQDEHQVIQQTTQNLPSHRSFLNGFQRYDGSGIPSNSQWPPSSSSSFENSSSQKVENYSRTATRITPPTLAGDDNPIGFRNQIDLNSVAEIPDQTPSDQTSSRRFVLDIDLEVPAQPEESFRINQHDPVENPESESNGNQENGGVDDDETIRITAGIIVSMFSDIPRCSVAPSPTTRTRPSDTNSVDSLRWFADVVISSNANEPEIAPLVTSDVGDGMDFFESMTLRLTDSQPEHSTQKPCRRDAENGEESGFASMLLTMGRKCQGKKRRQKKDFQKDILPGLSSLSKHEVTEDLQSFEKMMRASGLSWQVGGARRNGRQRRRRPRAVSAATTVQISSDPQPQPMQSNNANAEVGIDKGDLIGGWGRTRRCRRQRWASSSLAAAAAAGSLS